MLGCSAYLPSVWFRDTLLDQEDDLFVHSDVDQAILRVVGCLWIVSGMLAVRRVVLAFTCGSVEKLRLDSSTTVFQIS